MAADPASNVVLWVTSAHTMRASLFASAQVVMFECRRVSMTRTQSVGRALHVSPVALHQQASDVLVASLADPEPPVLY